MVVLAVANTSDDQSGPGFFLLAWGLIASVVGIGLTTNYRGFAEQFTRHTQDSTTWMRRLPPWKWIRERPNEFARRTVMARFLGIPFAVLGPLTTAAGVVQIVRGHVALPRGPALPLPIALTFIAFAVVVMGQYWRRGGFFRQAARQSGWMRAAAIAASVGALSFGVFTAVGQTTLGIAGWLVGGLASVPLIMARKSAPSEPRDRVD